MQKAGVAGIKKCSQLKIYLKHADWRVDPRGKRQAFEMSALKASKAPDHKLSADDQEGCVGRTAALVVIPHSTTRGEVEGILEECVSGFLHQKPLVDS